MTKYDTVKVTVKGEEREISVYRANNDTNGNPRYVVHFLDLGVTRDMYGVTKAPCKVGFNKYRGKDFGGGYVFTSYSVQSELPEMVKRLAEMI